VDEHDAGLPPAAPVEEMDPVARLDEDDEPGRLLGGSG
jgi:hypothetical protein